MTAAVSGSGRRVAQVGRLPRLVTPSGAAAIVDLVRVVITVVLVAFALAGLAVTGSFLAGPIPDVGPRPGF